MKCPQQRVLWGGMSGAGEWRGGRWLLYVVGVGAQGGDDAQAEGQQAQEHLALGSSGCKCLFTAALWGCHLGLQGPSSRSKDSGLGTKGRAGKADGSLQGQSRGGGGGQRRWAGCGSLGSGAGGALERQRRASPSPCRGLALALVTVPLPGRASPAF